MKSGHRFVSLLFLLLVLLLAFPPLAASIVTDRILAVVNNEVISLSDLQKYRALFEPGNTADDSNILKAMIDQKLLFAEALKLEIPPPSVEETELAYNNLHLQIKGLESFEKLKHRLSLSDAEIRQQIRKRLRIDKFIQERIRFFVFVTPEEVEKYYQDHPKEFPDQTLEEIRDALELTLAADKTQINLEVYLKRLRVKTTIRINHLSTE